MRQLRVICEDKEESDGETKDRPKKEFRGTVVSE